jgi:hypothetical protein
MGLALFFLVAAVVPAIPLFAALFMTFPRRSPPASTPTIRMPPLIHPGLRARALRGMV